MVHHYEPGEMGDTSKSDVDELTPTFTAVIEPPHTARVVDPPPPSPKEPEPEPELCPACPQWYTEPAAPVSMPIDALPTILIGIATAFAVGTLVGTLISNPPMSIDSV